MKKIDNELDAQHILNLFHLKKNRTEAQGINPAGVQGPGRIRIDADPENERHQPGNSLQDPQGPGNRGRSLQNPRFTRYCPLRHRHSGR